jgi:hypothetical protein
MSIRQKLADLELRVTPPEPPIDQGLCWLLHDIFRPLIRFRGDDAGLQQELQRIKDERARHQRLGCPTCREIRRRDKEAPVDPELEKVFAGYRRRAEARRQAEKQAADSISIAVCEERPSGPVGNVPAGRLGASESTKMDTTT